MTDDLADIRALAYVLLCLIERRADQQCFHDQAELMVLRQLMDRLGELGRSPTPDSLKSR